MSQLPRILVADDERSILLMLETGLTLNGFQVACARTGNEAISAAATGSFDAVLSDLYMPDGGGLDLVRALRDADASIPIIIMTAQGSVEAAVEAVACGATDFIGKPFEISAAVALLRQYLDARREARDSSEAGGTECDLSRSGLAGRSAPMVMVYKLIAQAARSKATVLINGESGTGKELVARAIHDFSARSKKPFISINCSGLTDTLIESELFGYIRGAFTGAQTERAGLFEAADGGTLFLDELASSSAGFQASLLRVLQSGEVRRVGSTQTRRVDVRVIAASNVSLRDLASSGGFRSDLYYRLSVLNIDLPPLRERAGDIEVLTTHFLQRFREPDQPPFHVTRDAIAALAAHTFPGNVRELENALRRAIALSSHGLITIDCLPPEIAAHGGETHAPAASSHYGLISDRPTMEELQRRYLQFILEETGWNRRRTASVLGLDRRTVQRLIARLGLQVAADPEDEGDLELDDSHEGRAETV